MASALARVSLMTTTSQAPRAAQSTLCDAAEYYGVDISAAVRILHRASAQLYTPLGTRVGVIEHNKGLGIVILRLSENAGQWHGSAGSLIVSDDAIRALANGEVR